MDFCDVEFNVLAAALNLLIERNPKVDIEDLKPKDLLNVCRNDMGAKFNTQLKDDVLAEQLFEHMSDNYSVTRHKHVHIIKSIKGARLVNKEIQFWADLVGHGQVKDEPSRYLKLTHIRQVKPVVDYLSKNFQEFQDLYEKASPKSRLNVKKFLNSAPELKIFAKMLVVPTSVGVKSVKLNGKKVQVSTDEGANWDLPLSAAARIPEIAEQLLKQLVK